MSATPRTALDQMNPLEPGSGYLVHASVPRGKEDNWILNYSNPKFQKFHHFRSKNVYCEKHLSF